VVKSFAERRYFEHSRHQSLMADIKKAMRINYFRTMSDGGALAQNVNIEIIPRKPSETVNEMALKPLDIFDIKLQITAPLIYIIPL
jgi:hypothetical protein